MKAGRFVACLAMFGVGAVAGTLSGGDTNAARSPQRTSHVSPKVAADPSPAVVRASSGMIASLATQSNTTTIAMTPVKAVRVAPERAPTAVVAMRFPTQWPQQPVHPTTGDNDPSLAMAYMAGAAQVATAASPSGYQLASVDPSAEPAPLPKRKPAAAKPPVLFNDAQLASIKKRLRLSRDQERYWPQVERALRAISYKIATQQNAKRPVVRGRQASMIDPNGPEVARLKKVAFPLIMSMREDQKQEVRQLAHTMGLKQVASMF